MKATSLEGFGGFAYGERLKEFMGKKLYVGNLPYSTSEGELEDLFGAAGAVESVRIITDRETGRARGFGFVEMANDDDAEKAIQQFNQYELDGRALTVNEARPREDRGGSGAGGGGRGYTRGEPRW